MAHEDKYEMDEQEYDSQELSSIIKTEMDDARDFIDQIGQERAENTDYYLGAEPVNGSELQSEYVSTDVRDSVLFMMPSIMRTFFGSKKIVEFVPQGPEDIELAEQQTDYINYVITQKNNGFQVLYNAFKDALIRKAGFVKVYYDEGLTVTNHSYTNLTSDQRQALLQDIEVEIVKEKTEEMTREVYDDSTGQQITQSIPLRYDIDIRRVKKKNKVCVDAVPPEEILISRDARTIETASYVAHRRLMTVSELVSMGYDLEEVEQYAGAGNYLDPETQNEIQARNPFNDVTGPDRADSKEVYYVEHYLHYDLDGDGIDERIKVCTAGEGCNILFIEPCDELPIAMFCPDPEPHTAIGSCPADYLKPIQAAKSQIMRDSLDSLGHAIFPRYAVVEGQVNLEDLMNTDIGQPIRQRAPGQIQALTTPFVGKEAFPVMNYLDNVKEERTGVSKASMGLNADALQSSTKAAVVGTMSAAQGRIELICRHFAETGLKPLFRIVNNVVIRNQNEQDVFKLNNKFIPVDPKFWDINKDIQVNVAISKSSDEEKAAVLASLLTKQEMILEKLGPNNPLVTGQQYANAMTKFIELAGFKDAQQFINTQVQEPPPPSPEQQKPDAQEMLAMAESEKAKASANKAIVDAENDRLKILMDDDFRRDQAQADAILKVMELNAKYGTELTMAEINAYLERDKEEIRQRNKSVGLNGSSTGNPGGQPQ